MEGRGWFILLEHSAGDCLPVVILHDSAQGTGRLTDRYIAQVNVILRTRHTSPDSDYQAKANGGEGDSHVNGYSCSRVMPYRQAMMARNRIVITCGLGRRLSLEFFRHNESALATTLINLDSGRFFVNPRLLWVNGTSSLNTSYKVHFLSHTTFCQNPE